MFTIGSNMSYVAYRYFNSLNYPDVTVSQRFKTRFHRLDFDAQDSQIDTPIWFSDRQLQ